MKAEEVHARLFKEALRTSTRRKKSSTTLPVCGNIEKAVPEKCSICGVPGEKFIKF